MTDNAGITVLGLGSMGRALAEAFLRSGWATTVWNRSPEKAAPLVALGAHQATAIEDAVAASPVIISCLSTFAATSDSLASAGTALAGRTLITLNSGTPSAAREMAAWARQHGVRLLSGAIKNVPAAVGNPDTQLYFGGPRELFDAHLQTLRILGGDVQHLGDEPDLAALYESAVGTTLLPALVGFFSGAGMLTARGLQATTMVPYATKWLQMIASLLPILAEEIDAADYTKLGSSVGVFHAALGNEQELGADAGIDMSWWAPLDNLVRRAMAEGYGEQSITALIEVLRRPVSDAEAV